MIKLKHILFCLVLLAGTVNAQKFTVNFSKWVDDPLIKTRFGIFQPSLAQPIILVNSHELLSELAVPFYRYEYAWGKEVSLEFEQINKIGNKLSFKIDNPNNDVDLLFNSIHQKNIKPLFVHCYTPSYLQQYYSWQSMVKNINDWEVINKKYAEHWKSKNFKAPAYEIWNAPDLFNVFFTGSRDDYNKLYEFGARGIRTSDRDALVGGMSSWVDFEFMAYWLDFIKTKQLPLDFVSIHAYEKWQWSLDKTRAELNKRGLHQVPIYLTEWMSFNNMNVQETGAQGPASKSPAAAEFFSNARAFLKAHDLTNIYWAQWRDAEWLEDGTWIETPEKIGMLTLQNQRKPLFNAFKLYGQLPVDRYLSSPDSIGKVYILSSGDNNNAASVVWNTGNTDAPVQVDMTALPFINGSVDIYKIDKLHGSIIECGAACENNMLLPEKGIVKNNSYTWKGTVPAQSVLMLHAKDNSGISLLTPTPLKNAVHIKYFYWFENRENDCYADFDPNTWIARLGSGKAKSNQAIIGNLIEQCPDLINVEFKASQVITKDTNTIVGIRVDYYNTDSTCSKSVFYYDKNNSNPLNKKINWGTFKTTDEQVDISSLITNNTYLLNIAQYAPTNWNKSRVTLTFLFENIPAQTQTRYILKP